MSKRPSPLNTLLKKNIPKTLEQHKMKRKKAEIIFAYSFWQDIYCTGNLKKLNSKLLIKDIP